MGLAYAPYIDPWSTTPGRFSAHMAVPDGSCLGVADEQIPDPSGYNSFWFCQWPDNPFYEMSKKMTCRWRFPGIETGE